MAFSLIPRLLAMVVVGGLVLQSTALAVKTGEPSQAKAREAVEMFAAIKARQINVRLIPKDATKATVLIANKTDQPLKIQLPHAFAGVPVLAQNLGGGGNTTSTNTTQTTGGGFGGGGMGMGGGFFNVAPEKVGKINVATVCLEHGKKDPNPRVPYEIKPISEFTRDARIVEVITMLANRQLTQPAAQAAAWHLTDGLSWQQLAQKVKVRHLNGAVEMYFNVAQLRTAMQAVSIARTRTASEAQTIADAIANSPGEQ